MRSGCETAKQRAIFWIRFFCLRIRRWGGNVALNLRRWGAEVSLIWEFPCGVHCGIGSVVVAKISARSICLSVFSRLFGVNLSLCMICELCSRVGFFVFASLSGGGGISWWRFCHRCWPCFLDDESHNNGAQFVFAFLGARVWKCASQL